MKLNIKPQAKKYLANKIPTKSNLLLTTTDGASSYANNNATCALVYSFQLIIINKLDTKFSISVDNNADYQIWMNPSEEYLFGNGLNLDFSHGALVLGDNGGVMDSAVPVIDWRNLTK
ncbi:iron-sulfur cluster biosynthesis family protein [Companilactobacillus formosensis]|uniref:iron-sulfur cluster biosynthesis family protein n=1 Tax=Companilactobacillus formosensis TaxID=1617889 RepID=UPI000E649A9F|nr:iron-sulfur cluster biosynthesis family protein [Companilactobacillus formosensis]